MHDLFAALAAADRATAEGEVAAAYRELERRGMIAPGTPPHVPGLLILDRTATAAAASIGAKGAPVLVVLPARDPLTRTRSAWGPLPIGRPATAG